MQGSAAATAAIHSTKTGETQSKPRGTGGSAMGDITEAAAAAFDDAQPHPPAMTKENNLFMQIVVNPDGTITRPEVPLIPPSSSSSSTTAAVSRDVPLDASLGTNLRLYLPNPVPTNSKLPVVLFFHGGGFVLFSPATAFYHAHCEAMAAALPCIVASLDYRLAPERRLPAAYDDAASAVSWLLGAGGAADPWVAAHADLSRCFVMGSSSGGNMAFFAGLRTKSAALRGLLLHQTYLGGVERTPSEAASGDDAMLPLEANDKLWSLALPEGTDRDHEFCNPVRAMSPEALAGMPRCLVTGNRGDPLIDRQRAFARWLADRGGVEVVARMEHEGGHAAELFVPESADELFDAMREFMSADDHTSA